MKFKHFIPHVQNKQLTRIAFESIKNILNDNIVIIDNSENHEIYNEKETWLPAEVLLPSQPLTTAQTMNWMREMSINENLDVFGFQHNDYEPLNDSVQTIYQVANENIANGNRFGIIFGDYDRLCIFSVKAVEEVGKWDWIYFPFYYLDNDYYERLEFSNYSPISLNLKGNHYNDGANTVRTNAKRGRFKELIDPISEILLKEKRENGFK